MPPSRESERGSYDGDPRDLAVMLVDRRHGYTCEFSPDPDAHRADYDEEEERLRSEPTRLDMMAALLGRPDLLPTTEWPWTTPRMREAFDAWLAEKDGR